MTAVEKLIEQLQAPCRTIPKHIIDEALVIEKQQIMDAYYDGRNYGFTDDEEEYYNEKFNK